MATREVRNRHGDLVRSDICIVPDHHTDTFSITIRSMRGVSAEQVRDHLQKLWEVNKIDHDQRVTYTQNG